jgi:hypothetical protein
MHFFPSKTCMPRPAAATPHPHLAASACRKKTPGWALQMGTTIARILLLLPTIHAGQHGFTFYGQGKAQKDAEDRHAFVHCASLASAARSVRCGLSRCLLPVLAGALRTGPRGNGLETRTCMRRILESQTTALLPQRHVRRDGSCRREECVQHDLLRAAPRMVGRANRALCSLRTASYHPRPQSAQHAAERGVLCRSRAWALLRVRTPTCQESHP